MNTEGQSEPALLRIEGEGLGTPGQGTVYLSGLHQAAPWPSGAVRVNTHFGTCPGTAAAPLPQMVTKGRHSAGGTAGPASRSGERIFWGVKQPGICPGVSGCAWTVLGIPGCTRACPAVLGCASVHPGYPRVHSKGSRSVLLAKLFFGGLGC